jgi:hypothetical protein
MCRKSLPCNVVPNEATKAAFESVKSRMSSAPHLLTPKIRHETEFVVETDSSKVGIVGVLLQKETS